MYSWLLAVSIIFEGSIVVVYSDGGCPDAKRLRANWAKRPVGYWFK